MKTEKIKDYFSKIVEEELEDYDKLSVEDRVISLVIVIFFPLILFFFVAHQMFSTGFFTAGFGILEMVLLYGTPIYWIFTCAVLLLELKDLSRDVDSFGGLIFVAIACGWLSIVFPFDFAYFANVLPESLKFLVQWISGGLVRVMLVLASIAQSILAIVSGVQRVMVRKELANRKK